MQVEGATVARLRKLAGHSQQSLANEVGLSERAIGLIENGRTIEPRPATLKRLADALGVNIADLVSDGRVAS